MNKELRHKRVRLLVSKANKKRKKQARQIDILCNDIIAAQRNFIKSLGTISFTAGFYESIVGTTDLRDLIFTAIKLIKDRIGDGNVAFFLRHHESFNLHMFETDNPIDLEPQHLENCFTPLLVDSICKLNKICTLNHLLEMGLQGNPACLNKISAATIPLGQSGSSLGFILIYRSSENKLTAAELNNISSVTSGLSRAIQFCQTLLNSSL